jgi:hypothetical protein
VQGVDLVAVGVAALPPAGQHATLGVVHQPRDGGLVGQPERFGDGEALPGGGEGTAGAGLVLLRGHGDVHGERCRPRDRVEATAERDHPVRLGPQPGVAAPLPVAVAVVGVRFVAVGVDRVA